MSRYPDFLGIGATGAGTSWLAMNLRAHPEIWMPPRKELHYFSRSHDCLSPSSFADDHALKRLFGSEDHNRTFRFLFKHNLASALRARSWGDFTWYLQYFLGTMSDAWYASLFKRAGSRTKGEITPAYALLDRAMVEHVRALMPHLKIIYILRNPVDRAWSSLKKDGLADASLEAMKAAANETYLVLRSQYIKNLTVWHDVFPEEQVAVRFFDEIEREPEQFLLETFKFLGVDASDKHITARARTKYNDTESLDMPDELRRFLAERSLPQVRELSDMFGGYASDWLNDVHRTLGVGHRQKDIAQAL